MIVELTTGPIELMPETEVEEVMQNVRMILGIRRGTVPIDRAFGLDTSALDSPSPAARAILTATVAKDIATLEPRARLVELTMREIDGVLEPIVRISVVEGG